MKKSLIAFSAIILSMPLAGAPAHPDQSQKRVKADIQKHCVDKKHDGEVHACLMDQKDKVTLACKSALESTRSGRCRNAPN